MINIFKTQDNNMVAIDEIEKDSWIHISNPTSDDLDKIMKDLSIDSDCMYAALDEEESSRIEVENDQILILIDIPHESEEELSDVTYVTIPFANIVTEDNLITICNKEKTMIEEFFNARKIDVSLKTRFIFQMFYKVAKKYLQYLRRIDKMSNNIEKKLHSSLRNKELIQLLDLEKSLVYFSTSLKANEIIMEKLLRGKIVRLFDEDEDLLEDVIIENKQAIEMSSIYSSILSGMMDAFASVISNNLNIVMKLLASITIVLSLPTMVASYFGMNVDFPFFGTKDGFFISMVISAILTVLAIFFLWRKKMF